MKTLTPAQPAVYRFLAKVNLDGPGGCWLWTGAHGANGYGQFLPVYRKPLAYAHRWSYEQRYGPIPEGLQIDHLCRVRDCVNPEHLEAVTQRENLRRGEGVVGVNSRKTHCPMGHPYDEANTHVNLRTGGRQCRACGLLRNTIKYHEKRRDYHEARVQAAIAELNALAVGLSAKGA